MQRTDMIDKMLRCFLECKKMDYSDQQAMDRALEVAEENGMLPPAIKNHKYNAIQASKYIDHPFMEYEESVIINQWEDENEQKEG